MMVPLYWLLMSGPHCNYIDIPTVSIRGPSFHNIIMSFYDSKNNIASMGVYLHIVEITLLPLPLSLPPPPVLQSFVKRLCVEVEVNARKNMKCNERKRASKFALPRKVSQWVNLTRRADVTRSQKQGCQWPHKKDKFPPKVPFERTIDCTHLQNPGWKTSVTLRSDHVTA